MNSLEASIRNTKSKGEVNSLRQKGEVPAIIYGGTEKNQKISLSKKQIKYLIEQENFLSNHVPNEYCQLILTFFLHQQLQNRYETNILKKTLDSHPKIE